MSFVLLSKKSNQTVTVSLGGHIELVVSTFTSSVDNRLNLALNRKGNATVTSDGFVDKNRNGCVECTFSEAISQQKAEGAVSHSDGLGKQLSGQGARTSWESVDLAKRHWHRSNSLVS